MMSPFSETTHLWQSGVSTAKHQTRRFELCMSYNIWHRTRKHKYQTKRNKIAAVCKHAIFGLRNWLFRTSKQGNV
jgi:hypothetical protein